MPVPTDITAGTITITNGSKAVTGVGTGWLASDIRKGDLFIWIEGGDGFWQPIVASVESNTALTLEEEWGGPTLTGAPYRLRYQWDSSRVSAQARQLIDQLGNGNIQALSGLTGPGVPVFDGPHSMVVKPEADFINGVAYDVQVDTLADRDAYDGQPEGFAVLVSDVGDGRSAIYSKASNTSGDWTDPAYVTGPSVTVDVGTVTPVPFGQGPDVSVAPVPGGVELNFDLEEAPTLTFPPVTTLPAGQNAGAVVTPVAGGYSVQLSIPRGPAGDINGVTPFWQSRITADATAAAAREGLGALGVGDYGIGTGAFNLSSLTDRASSYGRIFRILGGSPGAIHTGLSAIALPYGGSIENRNIRYIGVDSSRSIWVGYRTGPEDNGTVAWTQIRGFEDVTQSQAESGMDTIPRNWSEERIAQAIAARAPSVPSDIYRRSNILGVASQSEGTPTGAIIERGANANGEYVRFADGTQICVANVSFDRSGNRTDYDPPAAFAPETITSNGIGFPATSSGAIMGYYNSISSGTSSTGTWAVMNTNTSSPSTLTLKLFSIGRWF